MIPGGDERIWTLGSYRDAAGRPLASFTGRKLRQWPPGFGTGRAAEAHWDPAYAERGHALLDALGFHGLSQLETKRDPRDGRDHLIEVNTRSWLWVGLAAAAGVNLPLAAYLDAVGRPRRWPPGHRGGLRWMLGTRHVGAGLMEVARGEWTLGELAPRCARRCARACGTCATPPRAWGQTARQLGILASRVRPAPCAERAPAPRSAPADGLAQDLGHPPGLNAQGVWRGGGPAAIGRRRVGDDRLQRLGDRPRIGGVDDAPGVGVGHHLAGAADARDDDRTPAGQRLEGRDPQRLDPADHRPAHSQAATQSPTSSCGSAPVRVTDPRSSRWRTPASTVPASGPSPTNTRCASGCTARRARERLQQREGVLARRQAADRQHHGTGGPEAETPTRFGAGRRV